MESKTYVRTSRGACFDYLRDISNDRAATMRWFMIIKNICESGHSLDIFDCGVHIFDNFIIRYFESGENNLRKTKEFFGLVGAASILLSSKFHDQKSDLSFASFPYYKESVLADTERLILDTLEYQIDTFDTPLFLARKMCSNLPGLSDEDSKRFIQGVSETLACFYVNNIQTTFFSTTTVALSATLIQFSRQELNQNYTHYLFDSIDTSKLNDCEFCLQRMHALLAPMKTGEKSILDTKSPIETSPVSIAKVGKIE